MREDTTKHNQEINSQTGQGKDRDNKNHPGQAGGYKIPGKNINPHDNQEIKRNNPIQDTNRGR